MDKLRFKGYMAQHKISQKDVAKLLGVTPQSAYNKVNGREPFTLSQVKTICETYNISADEYFI